MPSIYFKEYIKVDSSCLKFLFVISKYYIFYSHDTIMKLKLEIFGDIIFRIKKADSKILCDIF